MTVEVWTRDGVRLETLREAFGLVGESPIGITYAVDAARFIRPHSGELVGFDGEDEFEIDLGVVYSARIFAEGAELRWHHLAGGEGRGVFVADQPLDPGPDWVRSSSEQKKRDHHYLLWTLDSVTQTWTRLADARVGSIWVPGSFEADRVRLLAREYYRDVGHGNVRVTMERYVGLENLSLATQEGGDR